MMCIDMSVLMSLTYSEVHQMWMSGKRDGFVGKQVMSNVAKY